ncbi:MAG: flavodoxin family protein, partial [Actinomycetota bacterium]|nr:flavodoxin family protein [Actinomycetota bacterium]
MLTPVSTSLCSERQRPAEHTALANILVVYHSKRGTLRALAQAAADGARTAGATVRLCRIPGPDDLPVSKEFPATAAESEPTLADLIWADGIVWGTPTYYGNVSAPVKQFIDSTSGLWSLGLLADCVVSGLTSSTSVGGGQESTLLGLYRSMYHWGALVVSTDSSTEGWHEVGGNSYGLSVCASAGAIAAHEHEMAREVGARVARFARRTHALRDQRRGEDCPVPQHNCRLPEAAGRPPSRLTVLVQDGPARLDELAGAVAVG